ncbi:hypothetical protein E3E36_03405 [Thermococcus sp. M36]|uniref:hypothetical protein n=1 Tax=Thermococcus sp. M36 TaxID=1638261 RepID=UPI001438D851|nr:hypothetical protein [Thermococcus sp. M36]NJE05205.1 hypothetical protein [Thermococcus sp. M36]
MGVDEVLDEIDRRIKRLQAEIEIAEERMRYLEQFGAPQGPSGYMGDHSFYYLLLLGIWAFIGFLVLLYLRNRLPSGVRVPILPYAVIAAAMVALPIVYNVLQGRREEKTLLEEAEERGRLARLVLSRFYRPFREAVEKNDLRAMEALADALLGDPILAEAMERTMEGDPKIVAYALYLYTRYSPELRDEVAEAIERLNNRPVRALLLELIGGQRL